MPPPAPALFHASEQDTDDVLRRHKSQCDDDDDDDNTSSRRMESLEFAIILSFRFIIGYGYDQPSGGCLRHSIIRGCENAGRHFVSHADGTYYRRC